MATDRYLNLRLLTSHIAELRWSPPAVSNVKYSDHLTLDREQDPIGVGTATVEQLADLDRGLSRLRCERASGWQ